MFQGPAPRHPYRPSRQRSWRAYYDYGGGLVTDWGVHLADVAHWYMKKDLERPCSPAPRPSTSTCRIPSTNKFRMPPSSTGNTTTTSCRSPTR